MRELVFMGNSIRTLKTFPDKVRGNIGYALGLAQDGQVPENAKPFKGYPGVMEIVEARDGEAYRAVYALKIGKHIYVLHIFQKKSVRGIKTPRPDLELIDARYKAAKRREEFNV
jgi:phage-related protein